MNAIGHNAPTDPFILFSESIEDLLLEANNYLDGKEIETEEQEAAVAAIFTRLRREAKGADEQRKAEKRPHDEAAKAVQEKWNPLLERAKAALEVGSNVLTAFLRKREAAQRAAAEAKRQEAERLAEVAAQTAAVANPESLADQTALKCRREAAAEAAKAADRAEKAKPQVVGGERRIGLRKRWIVEITNPVEFARWAWVHRQPEYLKFLEDLAEREGRHGPKGIPGIVVHEDKRAA